MQNVTMQTAGNKMACASIDNLAGLAHRKHCQWAKNKHQSSVWTWLQLGKCPAYVTMVAEPERCCGDMF
jgi:hypothetical protein